MTVWANPRNVKPCRLTCAQTRCDAGRHPHLLLLLQWQHGLRGRAYGLPLGQLIRRFHHDVQQACGVECPQAWKEPACITGDQLICGSVDLCVRSAGGYRGRHARALALLRRARKLW
jgi:hypothetical protein